MGVTKAEFDRFVQVQRQGTVNMLDSAVQQLASINKETHLTIISDYDALKKQFYPPKTIA